MSFIKGLFLAIIATIFLTYILGVSLLELLHVDVYMEDQLKEPFKVISVSALVTVLLVIAALAIILSVFGSIIFLSLLAIGVVIMFVVGVFWPVLLVGLFLWLMVKDNKTDRAVYN